MDFHKLVNDFISEQCTKSQLQFLKFLCDTKKMQYTQKYNYAFRIPNDTKFLSDLIYMLLEKFGNDINLNWIDVSELEDMSNLFHTNIWNFNGDISLWNTKNVKDISYMFFNSIFAGDISQWQLDNV